MSAMEDSRDQALAVLKRSSDFLTRQKSFRFEAHIGYDVVQPIGLKLEFGGERKILVRRPDHFRVEVSNRSGERSIIRFDGKTLSSFFPEQNAFATLDKPGSLEQTIAYLSDDIGLPMPLSDFMESNFYEAVVGDIELGVVVGEEKVSTWNRMTRPTKKAHLNPPGAPGATRFGFVPVARVLRDVDTTFVHFQIYRGARLAWGALRSLTQTLIFHSLEAKRLEVGR